MLLLISFVIITSVKSYSQLSTHIKFNYMTDNNETMNWGFTFHPEYKISHQFRVGVCGSFFLNSNPFPDYLIYDDGLWGSPPNTIAGNAHRILPIDLTLKYYFNKKEKNKLQPYFQFNSGVAILGTFSKAEIKNVSYVKYSHEIDNYFSLGFRIGADYKLSKNVDFNFDAGYSRVFNDKKNRFENAPADLNKFNSYFNHYFIFSAGFKFNLQ